jgi:hypothetical protein
MKVEKESQTCKWRERIKSNEDKKEKLANNAI